MTRLHACTALHWRRPGAAIKRGGGGHAEEVMRGLRFELFARRETYVLVVDARAGIPVSVSWAAAVPGRSRAVDAESTGPGAASYVNQDVNTTLFDRRTPKKTKKKHDIRGLSGVCGRTSEG